MAVNYRIPGPQSSSREKPDKGLTFATIAVAVLLLFAASAVCGQQNAELQPLDLRPESLQQRDIRVLSGGELQRVMPENIDRRIRSGATVVERIGEKPRLVSAQAGSTTYALPFTITKIKHFPRPIGAMPAPPPPTFQPFVKVTQAFRFVSAEQAHLAQVALFVVEQGRQRIASVSLPEPVEFTIAAEQADRVSPQSITIAKTNQYETANIVAVTPGEDFVLKIISVFNPEGDELPISRVPLDISLSLSKTTILGRGLETTDLLVTAPPKILNNVDAFVTLSAEQGSADFERPRLVFDAAGSAQVKIRSIGVGQTKIVAHVHPFGEIASVSVEFIEIWRWSIWVVAGALIGAVLGRLKQAEEQRSLARVLIGFSVGLVVGVGATFAYSQEFLIDVFRVPTIAAEIGAFILSFLFALFPQFFFAAFSTK